MPTAPLMVWIPCQHRWTKRYMGRRYYVSCRQLGIKPETKEASILAANQWWRDQQASIDLADKMNRERSERMPQPLEDIVSGLLGGPWATQEDIAATVRGALEKPPPAEMSPIVDQLRQWAKEQPADSPIWERFAEVAMRLLPTILERFIADGAPLSEILRKNLPPARIAQIERGVKELRGEQATKTDRTVKALVDEWLLKQRTQVSIGGLSATRYNTIQRMLCHFTAFIGETADVSTIDAERLEGFHFYCLSKIADQREDASAGWASYHAKQVFSVAKQWIGWLVGRGTIPEPTNFRQRWGFGPTVKPIKTWPVEDIRRVVCEASGKLRLCLLLMLNCGMSQKDASDLLDDEVDWREGRIIRKRSKTGHLESVPVVNYKLWPTTLALLGEHRSGQERVLLTASGKPFVNRRVVDGKFRAVDSFGTMLRMLTKRLGINRPLKQLRKSAASLLENHTATLPSGELVNPFAPCVSLFLGHSPKSMREKHYAKPPQALFDAAVTWLGETLALAELSARPDV